MRHFTILEADGQYNDDNALEQAMFAAGDDYTIRFVRGSLAPVGYDTLAPWTDIPKDLRDEVDGLMILKLFITRDDLELFPRLKV